MSDKNISMASYQWGHFGAILADVVVFSVIAFFSYRSRISIINSSGNTFRKTTLLFNLNVIFWLSIIVAFITLLGLIPVFKDYDRIIIS